MPEAPDAPPQINDPQTDSLIGDDEDEWGAGVSMQAVDDWVRRTVGDDRHAEIRARAAAELEDEIS